MTKLNIAILLSMLEERLSLGAGNGLLWLFLMGALVFGCVFALTNGRGNR